MSTNSKITALKSTKQVKTGPKSPGHLKTAGRKLWMDLNEMYEFNEHDYVLLTSWAETLDRKNRAEKDLRKHGSLTFENRHGELRAHPLVGVIRDCNVLMARLRRELALSENELPDSRPPKLRYGGPK
jgi:phage terminase small subunit